MTAFATTYWWYWLLCVFLTFDVSEVSMVVYAHYTGQKSIFEWTLSDTIRRWSGRYKWLAPVVAGTTVFLLWHFFLESNAPS